MMTYVQITQGVSRGFDFYKEILQNKKTQL